MNSNDFSRITTRSGTFTLGWDFETQLGGVLTEREEKERKAVVEKVNTTITEMAEKLKNQEKEIKSLGKIVSSGEYKIKKLNKELEVARNQQQQGKGNLTRLADKVKDLEKQLTWTQSHTQGAMEELGQRREAWKEISFKMNGMRAALYNLGDRENVDFNKGIKAIVRTVRSIDDAFHASDLERLKMLKQGISDYRGMTLFGITFGERPPLTDAQKKDFIATLVIAERYAQDPKQPPQVRKEAKALVASINKDFKAELREMQSRAIKTDEFRKGGEKIFQEAFDYWMKKKNEILKTSLTSKAAVQELALIEFNIRYLATSHGADSWRDKALEEANAIRALSREKFGI